MICKFSCLSTCLHADLWRKYGKFVHDSYFFWFFILFCVIRAHIFVVVSLPFMKINSIQFQFVWAYTRLKKKNYRQFQLLRLVCSDRLYWIHWLLLEADSKHIFCVNVLGIWNKTTEYFTMAVGHKSCAGRFQQWIEMFILRNLKKNVQLTGKPSSSRQRMSKISQSSAVFPLVSSLAADIFITFHLTYCT